MGAEWASEAPSRYVGAPTCHVNRVTGTPATPFSLVHAAAFAAASCCSNVLTVTAFVVLVFDSTELIFLLLQRRGRVGRGPLRLGQRLFCYIVAPA